MTDEIYEAIRKQLQINVRDGLCGPSSLDVEIDDQWETLPCQYRDGLFTVTRGKERLGFSIQVELVSRALI